jgi:electron transport complex protein RnfE
MIGTFREVLGYGSILGFPVFGPDFEPWIVMILPPGGFLTLGFILIGFGWWTERKTESVRPRQWMHGVTDEVGRAV